MASSTVLVAGRFRRTGGDRPEPSDPNTLRNSFQFAAPAGAARIRSETVSLALRHRQHLDLLLDLLRRQAGLERDVLQDRRRVLVLRVLLLSERRAGVVMPRHPLRRARDIPEY